MDVETMDVKLAEKAKEQEFFDRAATLRPAPARPRGDPVSGPGAGLPVAVGRFDTANQRRYVGYQPIRDGEGRMLVADWRSRAAVPYYRARPEDPVGVTNRRTYECEGNRILDFADLPLRAGPTRGELTRPAKPAAVDGFLLRALGRGRDGIMRDIVATIQADQFEVVRQPPDHVMILDGGPGTGKTAIALHRVSWLLANYPLLRGDGVLVVGPNPTFVRYINQVLPGLGDHEVVHQDLGSLAPNVRRGRAEPEMVAHVKGDPRMAGLLRRALYAKVRVPRSEPFAAPGLFAPADTQRVRIGRETVYLPNSEISKAFTGALALNLPYARGRDAFRSRLAGLATDRAEGHTPGTVTLGRLVDRFWPLPTPMAFLGRLFASAERLRQAAAGQLREQEVALLYRRRAHWASEEEWSEADLPLLDELDYLLSGRPCQYGHVLVDEAQDLSPMQLRSLVRRTRAASMTLIGDLAQSSRPWSRERWSDLTTHLPTGYPVHVQTLRRGYRVPRQAYDLAARLLAVAAPEAVPPDILRDGPDPRIHLVCAATRPVRVVALACEHAAAGRFVGIVCPQQFQEEIETGLNARGIACNGTGAGPSRAGTSGSGRRGSGPPEARITLLEPREAKGLEFDAVVVVEPELIVAESAYGHRMLYTALTRTTGYLDIVGAGEPLSLTGVGTDTAGVAGPPTSGPRAQRR